MRSRDRRALALVGAALALTGCRRDPAAPADATPPSAEMSTEAGGDGAPPRGLSLDKLAEDGRLVEYMRNPPKIVQEEIEGWVKDGGAGASEASPTKGGRIPLSALNRIGGGRDAGRGDGRSSAPPVIGGRPAERWGVRLGTPAVRGQLDPQAVRERVRERTADALECHRRALQRRPGLTGRVAVAFVVSASGGVQSARVHDRSIDQELGSCLVAVIRPIRFTPPAEGLAIVTLPFEFVDHHGR